MKKYLDKRGVRIEFLGKVAHNKKSNVKYSASKDLLSP